MARLRVLKDGAELQNVDLARFGKPALVLGRAAESDIKLDDRAVGREHAVFQINPKGLSVQKKSKFGKLAVNGAETAEAALKPGDVISIADYQVRIEEDTSPPPVSGENTPPQGTVAPGAEGAAMEQPPDLAAVPEGDTNDLKIPAEGAAAEGGAAPVGGALAAEGQSGEAPALEAPVEGGLALENSEGSQATPAGEGFNAEAGDRTAMIPQAKIVTKLVFKAGEANVEEFVIKKPEISIGRGTVCDIVLTDKKSSRKHLIIKRVGMNFVAKDLGSANGTHVNGVKITEQELAGDDVLRIGETEFTFKAISQEYFDQEQAQAFIAPPAEEPQPEADPNAAAGGVPMDGAGGAVPLDPNALAAAGGGAAPLDPNALPGATPGLTGTIPGLGPSGPKKKETLLDKFKRQPTPRKVMIVAVIGVVVILALQPDEEDPKKKPKPNATATAISTDAAFNALPPERQQFVVNSYQLAFDLYKKQEFERAVYEVDKILQVLPGGYKDAKEIRSFAQKSIDIQKANEEERRRKEAEERLRKEVAEFVAQAEKAVADGKDAEAKEAFAKVLERDPDNPTILRLRQQIEEKEQQRKAAEEAEKDKEFKRKQIEAALTKAKDLLAAGRYYDVIEKVDLNDFLGDDKAMETAKGIIAKAHQAIKAKVQPFLDAGKAAMNDSNYTAARDAYYKALKIEVGNAEARRGLDKIRAVLHDRSKKIFTDAIVAESVSDYRTARAKYKECLDSAMREDKYFGMCTRKFQRFDGIDRSAASAAPMLSPSESTDPKEPTLPAPAATEEKPAPVEKPAEEKPAEEKPSEDPAPPKMPGSGGW